MIHENSLGILSVLFSAVAACAGSMVLQNGLNGYTGCNDSYVIMASDATAGNLSTLVVEGYHCTLCIDQRALIRFDVSSITPSTIISKATLSIYNINQPRPGPSKVFVHKITKNWNESTVSWNSAEIGVPWKTSGADFEAADTSYQYGDPIGVWHSMDITRLVQNQISQPDKNFGILLFMEDIMHTARYTSSNYATQGLRPKLTLESSYFLGVKNLPHALSSKNSIFQLKGNVLLSSVSGKIELVNLSGRKVFGVTGNYVDVSNIPKGVYTVRVQNNHGISLEKVAISK